MTYSGENRFVYRPGHRLQDIRGGADKFLARPRKKQDTEIKLGIYSTYSPRSSIHFLARCSNFCKPLKKKFQKFVGPTGSQGAAMTSASDEKWRNFNCFFLVQGTGGSPTGPDRKTVWVIKTLEAQVDQFLLGCKCPVRRGIVVQEQDPLGEIPGAFFFKMSFNCTSRDE